MDDIYIMDRNFGMLHSHHHKSIPSRLLQLLFGSNTSLSKYIYLCGASSATVFQQRIISLRGALFKMKQIFEQGVVVFKSRRIIFSITCRHFSQLWTLIHSWLDISSVDTAGAHDHYYQFSQLGGFPTINSFTWLKAKSINFAYTYHKWWRHPLICMGISL